MWLAIILMVLLLGFVGLEVYGLVKDIKKRKALNDKEKEDEKEDN